MAVMGDIGSQGREHFTPGQDAKFAGFSGGSVYQGGESPQAIIDREHLRLLRIGYFISAGQTALLVPFGLLYAGMGVVFSRLPTGAASTTPPMMSWIFAVFGGLFALIAGLVTALKLLTAVRLKERRSRVLCLVSAAFALIEIPYGTALGIMTFVVLARTGVREQFDRPR
jgi:hypothetical protein